MYLISSFVSFVVCVSLGSLEVQVKEKRTIKKEQKEQLYNYSNFNCES